MFVRDSFSFFASASKIHIAGQIQSFPLSAKVSFQISTKPKEIQDFSDTVSEVIV